METGININFLRKEEKGTDHSSSFLSMELNDTCNSENEVKQSNYSLLPNNEYFNVASKSGSFFRSTLPSRGELKKIACGNCKLMLQYRDMGSSLVKCPSCLKHTATKPLKILTCGRCGAKLCYPIGVGLVSCNCGAVSRISIQMDIIYL